MTSQPFDEVEAALERLPTRSNCEIALRASLRVAPAKIGGPPIFEEGLNVKFLQCRADLLSASFVRHSKITPAFDDSIKQTTNNIFLGLSDFGISSAFWSLKSSYSLQFDPKNSRNTAQAFRATRPYYDQALADKNELDRNTVSTAFSLPLWKDNKLHDNIRAKSDKLLREIPKKGSPWSFWRNWYEGFLTGEPLDWELQRRVALIPDDVWEAGVEAVAEAIEVIEATLELEQEIEALRNKWRTDQILASSGHNQGPPLDDGTIAIRSRFDLVWPILDEIETEAKKETPDPNHLKALAQKLWDISIVIAKYCGGKVDLALNKAVETAAVTGTKIAIGTGATVYLSSNESVQSVAKAALQLAKTLAGG